MSPNNTLNTLSPYLSPNDSSPRQNLPELEGNHPPPRHELGASARQGRPLSLGFDGQVRHELAAHVRSQSLAPLGTGATDRAAPSFRSLVTLANAVMGDEKFQFENKQQLENLIYHHYQSFPLSPKEAAEIRSRHTPKQYREIFEAMAKLAHKFNKEVTIRLATPPRAEQLETPFQAVWNGVRSDNEIEMEQLYSSDFIIKPRARPNEPLISTPESRWVELSITVRSRHAPALAKVLIDMVSKSERGPGMVKQAVLVGANKQETSSITAILHFSETDAKYASEQEKIVHKMLLKETGATLSGLYAACPPGWESPDPEHGTACFERDATIYPHLNSGRLISHILADAISESCRHNLEVPNAISFHLKTNGYTGARLPPPPAHTLPRGRSHSAHAIFRSQLSLSVALALQDTGFMELLRMTQVIAKDPTCRSGLEKVVIPKVYQYYTNYPHTPIEAREIRSSQTSKQLEEKIKALNTLSTSYAATVDIYMQRIGDGERLQPDAALTQLIGDIGYDKALDKVSNADLIIVHKKAQETEWQNAVLRVLSISVKEEHALLLAEILTEIVALQEVANDITKVKGLKYVKFSKVASLATRAETAAIHFVDPEFTEIAELAEWIETELAKRLMLQGVEASAPGKLHGEFPRFLLKLREGMIYREIPAGTAQDVVPSIVRATSHAFLDYTKDGKNLATFLYQRLLKNGHLPGYPSFVSEKDDKSSRDRVRKCIEQLHSRTPKPTPNMPAELSAVSIMPKELSAD